MHSSVRSNITSYKSQGHNRLCPPLNPPTILGTKTAPFFAVLSSGSLDYQRLTAIWEPHFQARGPGAGQSCSNRDLLTEISAMGIQLDALDHVKLKTSASVSARIGPR